MARDETHHIVGSSGIICKWISWTAEPSCNVQKIEASVAVDVHPFGVRHACELLRSRGFHGQHAETSCISCGTAICTLSCVMVYASTSQPRPDIIYHFNLSIFIPFICFYCHIIYKSIRQVNIIHLSADRGYAPRYIWKFHPWRIETQGAHLESCRVTAVRVS